MKKYIISTSIAFVAIGTVFAQDAGDASSVAPREPAVMGRMQVTGAPTGGVVNTMYGKASAPTASARAIPANMMAVMPTITTGDTALDAKIKALQEERIAKLKALNAEYDVKLKALIGNKTITIGRPAGQPGSTTGDAGRGNAMPGTPVVSAVPAQNGEPTGEYNSRDGDAMGENRPAAGIRGFIGRFFGRNN